MAFRVTTKWAEPKPGSEVQYMLAMKHRAIASELMLRETKRFRSVFWPWSRRYNRLYRLWSNALDRMKRHGRDVVRTMP